jgi:hypothetical protein
MGTADTEASTMPQAGWLRRTWEKVATVIAVVGLIDFTGQLIHWAKLIHEIVTQYAVVRGWLFGWLPFHIPPQWHDPIVLLLIFFSMTNVGLYRRTRHTFFYHIRHNFWTESLLMEWKEMIPTFFGLVIITTLGGVFGLYLSNSNDVGVITTPILFLFITLLIVVMLHGTFLAWR